MPRGARCQSPRALLSISTTSGRTKTGGKFPLRYVQPAKAADLPAAGTKKRAPRFRGGPQYQLCLLSVEMHREAGDFSVEVGYRDASVFSLYRLFYDADAEAGEPFESALD